MKSADEFLSFITRFGPALYPSQTYIERAQALVAISAALTDKQKMIAEYWANGPHTELRLAIGTCSRNLFRREITTR